jgi:hypothetical protein
MMRRRRVPSRLNARPRDRRLPLEILRLRLARLMIERYGADAVTQAAMQSSALLAKGDMEGRNAWLKVIAKIDLLQATKPAEGEQVQ